MQWLMAQIRENGGLYTKTFRLILIWWEERMLHLPHSILNNPQLSRLIVLRAISVWSVTSFQPNICAKKTWYVYRNTVEPWLTERLLSSFLYRTKKSIQGFFISSYPCRGREYCTTCITTLFSFLKQILRPQGPTTPYVSKVLSSSSQLLFLLSWLVKIYFSMAFFAPLFFAIKTGFGATGLGYLPSAGKSWWLQADSTSCSTCEAK